MKKLFAIVACASVALITGCGQVDTGEVGFFTRWGEIISKEPLSEGLHGYEPIGTDLITYSIKNQTMTIKTEVFTKDVQQMQLELSVTFNLEKNKVIELHASTGKQYAQVLIVPCVLGAAKDALGKMEADAIVGNREIATANIHSAIKEKLSPYGINVTLVNIANIDYSDEYEKAIEEKRGGGGKGNRNEEQGTGSEQVAHRIRDCQDMGRKASLSDAGFCSYSVHQA